MQEIQVKVTKFSARPCWLMYYDDPLTGKRVTRSTKQTTKGEAVKAAGKWEAELREGRYKPKSNITWAEFRAAFLESLADAPPRTFGSYVSALNALERHCKVDKLVQLTQHRITYAADQWRKADGLSIETVAGYLRHLRAALNWAVSADMLRERPRITMPKRQKGAKLMKGRAISGEEFERMLAKVEAGIVAVALAKPAPKDGRQRKASATAQAGYRERLEKRAATEAPGYKRLLRGLWLSGLRLGEALELSWDDESKPMVDLSGKRPMLRILADQQKGRRDTLLPITPDFAEFLLTTPEGARMGDVFPLGCNRELAYVSKVIAAAGKAAGVVVDKASGKFASAHDLRRSFGVRWAGRVMPAVLKDLMRHADVATTMKYYIGQNAESTADAVWAAAERINAAGIKQTVNSGLGSVHHHDSCESQTIDQQEVL